MTSTTRERPVLTSAYRRLVGAEADAAVAANGLRQVTANSLQSIGDQVVNAKTVLPWLFALLGVPAGFTGLLVPVRESGSMLPQAALTPWVTSRRRRRGVWVLGALGQATSTLVIAAAAAWAGGALAGVVVVGALAVFALSRSLCSLAGKDVLGRTVPKGQRGRITGVSTTVSGVVALTLGLGLRLTGSDVGSGVLAALLVAAAVAWAVAAAVYAGVREPEEEPPPEARGRDEGGGDGWLRPAWGLLRDDAVFRRFVVARALLLVSALAPPFVVTAAAGAGQTSVSGLAGFVVASGLANLVGGRLFGGSADRSSRRLMVGGAATASAVVLAVVGLLLATGGDAPGWVLVAAFFVLSLVHVGVRVGRKTYVVDAAEGDRRTEYVAVANTAMGVLLLVVGLLATAVAALGVVAALAFLGALGVAGVVATRRLPEVSSGR